MSKFPILAFFCFACLALACGCAVGNGAPTANPAQATLQPQDAQAGFTALVEKIRESPGDFAGQTVEIVGYFRGWDLLGEAGGGPPVTRSDWVVKDASGAIYVTGPLPEGLDPASREDTLAVVRLSARVAVKGEAAYLEAQAVEVVPRP